MRFEVWAPNAGRVELDTVAELILMTQGNGGWWSIEVPDGTVTDYGFRLDGGEPLPDPRSPWQPTGPHGRSRVVDHESYRWSDADWTGLVLPAAVLYELHIGTFSPEGTFDGAIARLDHLVDLGVNAIELMPIAEFPGSRNWGYDGVNLYAPHSAYGGPDACKRLVDAAHSRGVAVVLDVVYNHLGPEGNDLARFGPYFTDEFATPWGDALNYGGKGSDEVRRFVLDNALMWLRDYHVDGLRLDAVHAIHDPSARHILEQLAAEVHELQVTTGRSRWVIAESDLHDPRLLRPAEVGGYGLDGQWSDDLHHAIHTTLTSERHSYYVDFDGLRDLGATLRRGWPHAGRWSRFRERSHGQPFDRPGWQLVGYAQNHDQVGNRAQGDRLSQQLPLDLLQVAAALVITAPFLPMLFQGEEWGASTPFPYFTSHADPELARAVTSGRRREFQELNDSPHPIPDPQDPDTFVRAKLDWHEVDEGDHARLLRWHRELLELRRTTPDLRDGRLDELATEVDEEAGTIVVHRGSISIAVSVRSAPVPAIAGEALLGAPRVSITRRP